MVQDRLLGRNDAESLLSTRKEINVIRWISSIDWVDSFPFVSNMIKNAKVISAVWVLSLLSGKHISPTCRKRKLLSLYNHLAYFSSLPFPCIISSMTNSRILHLLPT